MPCLPIDYEALASASATFPADKPIYMLNLLKFRKTASYKPEDSALAGEACTGREAWTRYVTALRPLLPSDAARFFISNIVTNASAPKDETWDIMGVNMYPSLSDFIKMVENEEYKKNVRPHREAALEDFRLIVMDKQDI